MVVFDDDYGCVICSERFDSEQEMNHHLMIVHTVPQVHQNTHMAQSRVGPNFYGINNMSMWQSPTETLLTGLNNEPHWNANPYISPMLQPVQPTHLLTPPSSRSSASRTSVSPMALPNAMSTPPQMRPSQPPTRYISPAPLSIQHYGVGPYAQGPQNVFAQNAYAASPAVTLNTMSYTPQQNIPSQYSAPNAMARAQTPQQYGQQYGVAGPYTNGALRPPTPQMHSSPNQPLVPTPTTSQPISWQNAAYRRTPVPVSQQHQQLGIGSPRVNGYQAGPAQQAQSAPLSRPKVFPTTPQKPSRQSSIGRSPKVPQSPQQNGGSSATQSTSQTQFMKAVYASPRQLQNSKEGPRGSLTPTSPQNDRVTQPSQVAKAPMKTAGSQSTLPQEVLDLGLTPDDFDPTTFSGDLRCTPAKYKDIPPPIVIPDRLLFKSNPNTVLCFGNLLRLAVRYTNSELVEKANQDRPSALFDAPLINKRITQAVKWANKHWEWHGEVADARAWLEGERKLRGTNFTKQKRKRKDSVLETATPSKSTPCEGSEAAPPEDAPPAKRIKQTPQASPRCSTTTQKPATLLDGLRRKALPNIQGGQTVQQTTPVSGASNLEQTSQHNGKFTAGAPSTSIGSSASPAPQPPVVASTWRPASMATTTSTVAPAPARPPPPRGYVYASDLVQAESGHALGASAPVNPPPPPGYVYASDLVQTDTGRVPAPSNHDESKISLAAVGDLIDTIGEEGALMLLNAVGGWGRVEQPPPPLAMCVPADTVDLTSATPSPTSPSGVENGNHISVAAPPISTTQEGVSMPKATTPQVESKKRKFQSTETLTPTLHTGTEKYVAAAMPAAPTSEPDTKKQRLSMIDSPTPTLQTVTEKHAAVAVPAVPTPQTETKKRTFSMTEQPTSTPHTDIEKHAAVAISTAPTPEPETNKKRKLALPPAPTPTLQTVEKHFTAATSPASAPSIITEDGLMMLPPPVATPGTASEKHSAAAAPVAATPQITDEPGVNYDNIFAEFASNPEHFLSTAELHFGEAFYRGAQAWTNAQGFYR